MHVVLSIAVLSVLYFCDVCAIRVPVNWDSSASVVQPNIKEYIRNGPPVETYDSLNNNDQTQQPIPVEYFQYTAKKPQFAVDIASFHGVKNPQDHYTAYPVKPYTGKVKPDLGKHKILDQNRPLYEEFQKYVKDDEKPKQVSSVSSNYEVFHPYKDEEPALQELYKDPILDKIRSDIRDNKNRLQNYENEAGKPNVSKDEYLESLDQTDNKKRPQKNHPATYEIHRPLRRPVYYQNPQHLYQRDHYLNRRFKNPWNHHSKVRPINYMPIKHHLQSLRQHHAIKYDDEHNEYPQLPPKENFAEPPDGYDIYEKGQQKYKQLRDQLDESINESIKQNRPTNYNKLEMQNDGTEEDDTSEDEEEEDFVPIKNYAQVRKTETFKHLPRKAAFDDADNLDEIKNAPRLKEAVKSTKAQTVYTEEGYEDTAYDHAGEQKHAGDHEAHEGFLREKELSGGNYKTPSVSADHEDGNAVVYRDQLKDGKQWKDSKKENENENHQKHYTENEQDDFSDVDAEDHFVPEESNVAESRESVDEKSDSEHGVSKRDVNLQVPEINLNDTLLTEKEITELAQISIKNKTQDALIHKYPYYFKNNKNINKDSPLRYAEDLKLIPIKRKSNTAFYDSKSKFQCPDIDDQVDPIPEHLKNGERPESDEKSEENDDSGKTEDVSEKEPRLKGLGDKIDCFKAKYFGEDPLDSPFFNEPLIENPEPVTVPNIDIFRLSPFSKQSNREDVSKLKDSLHKKNNDDLFLLLQKLNKPLFNKSFELLNNQSSNNSIRQILPVPTLNTTQKIVKKENNSYVNREKRDTSFVYEPYKIIRDSKTNESKKLQKHLKFDPHIDSPNNYYQEKDRPVKRNVGTRSYINIGKNERTNSSKDDDTTKDIIFVNVDKRRGEPKYEVKVNNHKSRYSPVHDQRSMSIEDYRKKITNAPKDNNNKTSNSQLSTQLRQMTMPTELHKTSSSNSVQRILSSASSKQNTKSSVPLTQENKETSKNKNTSIEEYDEYDSEEEEDEDVMTTTTLKPQFRKKTRGTTTTTTTTNPVDYEEIEEKPKLKLVTRFRNRNEKEINDDKGKEINRKEMITSRTKKLEEPKYIEKKKKSSKSTLVTDTNTYADNDDDMRKEEVDSLIGVQHNMDDYVPLYEKEMEKSPRNSQTESNDDDEDDSSSEEDDYESTEDNDSEEEEEEEEEDEEPTTQSTKNNTTETVEVPQSNNKNRSNRITEQPIIVRKRIEIHKEIPSNKSLPHVTQFKQDFKEIEITKEIPIKRKLKKNSEALELYKDQNLAKDINTLKSVEVFKENLDLSTAPKHGGNYRSARISLPSNSTQSRNRESTTIPQSRNAKLIELDDSDESFKTHEIDLDSSQESYKNKGNHNRRTEDSEGHRPQLHGGNLKKSNLLKPRRENKRSRKPAKLIELSEEHEEYDRNNKEERNSKSSDSDTLHGGNYRSAKLTQLVRDDSPPKDAKANAAALLNSFAQAVPILTTTPAYILDPSKRMYYYVDT